jgi:hypothetical protein
MQVVINQETQQIICLNFGPGHCHDFSLFKKSNVHFHPETDSLQDSGYQGIKDYRSNSSTPKKNLKMESFSFRKRLQSSFSPGSNSD